MDTEDERVDQALSDDGIALDEDDAAAPVVAPDRPSEQRPPSPDLPSRASTNDGEDEEECTHIHGDHRPSAIECLLDFVRRESLTITNTESTT